MSKKIVRKSILIFISFLLVTNLAEVLAYKSDFISLEEKIENIRIVHNIPTVHIGITYGTQLVWTKGFGDQTALDTLFPVASIQKTFIGTAILQLYEQGLIELDKDVSDYLPFEVKHPDFPEDTITVQMLLTHTSGLASEIKYEFYWDTNGYFTPEYRSDNNPSILEMSLGEYLNESFSPGGYNYYSNMWLYKPNERYSYSNTGFKLLQYIIEYNTGLEFEEYLQKHIFEPCQMADTIINGSGVSKNYAIAYTRKSGTNIELPLYSSRMIQTSATDLSHFLIAQLNDGEYKGKQILSKSTIEMMHEDIVQHSSYRNNIIQDESNYKFNQISKGLGWSQFTDNFGGHGGSAPGLIAVMAGREYPTENVGIVLFMNVNGILGSSEDFEEAQLAYNEFVNAILFELNLIPTFNQSYINLFIFVATISLALIVMPHYFGRIVQKIKIESRKKGFIIFYLFFVIFLGAVTTLNFFYFYDWIKLVLFLPAVFYSGFIILYNFRNKTEWSIPLYLENNTTGIIQQIWLITCFIGLGLYNLYYSNFLSILTSVLCIGSIALIIINSVYRKKIRA